MSKRDEDFSDHDFDDTQDSHGLPEGFLEHIQSAMSGKGMPKDLLGGLMASLHHPSPEVPDIEPDDMPTRKSFVPGDRIQLTKEARKVYSAPKRGSYAKVLQVYPSVQWQMDEGNAGSRLTMYDILVAMQPKGRGEDAMVYHVHSWSFEPYVGPADIQEIEDLHEGSRKDFLVGDKVQLDGSSGNHSLWPRAPHYGVIVDVFPHVSYLPGGGHAAASYHPYDCVVRLVTPSSDTENYMMFTGDFKMYVEPTA